MFTHNVLYARSSPDDVEERGAITHALAIQLFREFPFASELEKRTQAPDLMVPTITFRDKASNLDLAIWSEALGRFVIWFPASWASAENVTEMAHVEECIDLFFDRRTDELVQRISSGLGMKSKVG